MCYTGRCWFENFEGECSVTQFEEDIIKVLMKYNSCCDIGQFYEQKRKLIDELEEYKNNKEHTEFLINIIKMR